MTTDTFISVPSGTSFEVVSMYIIQVFIDCLLWADHISLYKLDVSYLCVIFINYYYYCMYFIVKTRSALCLLLSNDKFCIQFGGSLEYWINEHEWISVSSQVPLCHCWQSYILLYTVNFGSVPSPVSQCLIISRSLSFHLAYTVITITSTCESSFCYRSLCGGSFMFPVSLLCSLFFLLYR